MTQEELILLMKANPDKGIQAVTKQYAALVYKIAWGKLSTVCSAEDIEETVSDVFYDFYKNFESVDLAKGSLTSFIMILAQRRSVDAFRRLTRQKFMFDLIENTVSDKESTENTILKNEERNLLFDSILKLGEPDSTIIFRRFYYNENYSEIGKKTGLSENAVNKRCLRAIEKLSQMMKGDDISDL